MDPIHDALQQVLDQEGDGWTVSHYAVIVGIERMTPHGEMESTAYIHSPDEQPIYVTSGLLLDGAKQLPRWLPDDDQDPSETGLDGR